MRVPNLNILCVAGQLRDRFTVWVRIEYLNPKHVKGLVSSGGDICIQFGPRPDLNLDPNCLTL